MLIGINIDNQLELDDDGEEEEDNRMVVTLARPFLNPHPFVQLYHQDIENCC